MNVSYRPLTTTPPRLERYQKAKAFDAKAAQCHQLAEQAPNALEKEAWVALRDDWLALAKEAVEPAVWVEEVQKSCSPQRPGSNGHSR